MTFHRRCHFLFIFVALLPTSLGFTAHLQTPWEKYPPLSPFSRFTDGSLASKPRRGEALTAKDESSSRDEPKENTETSKSAKESSAKPRVFVASSTDVVDTMDNSPLTMVNGSPLEPAPTIRSCLGPLLQTCRPSNFFGVALFHVLGIYLALGDAAKVLPALINPQMLITLMVLLGMSSTSMVINDYYDTKSGVDKGKVYKPLVGGKVPMIVVRNFLNYVYAALLLFIAVMPGVATRLSAVSALLLTFWYTKHLKPITWLKNFVCATIMAFAPITSGSAALYLSNGGSVTIQQLLSLHSLWRLVAVLFAGFMGREIVMDCNDVVDDRLHGIRTVPVKYGRKFGAGVALSFSTLAAVLTMAGPLLQHNTRRLVLAGLGSIMMLLRGWHVYRTEGQDKDVVDKFVEEGKLTVMFILASFV